MWLWQLILHHVNVLEASGRQTLNSVPCLPPHHPLGFRGTGRHSYLWLSGCLGSGFRAVSPQWFLLLPWLAGASARLWMCPCPPPSLHSRGLWSTVHYCVSCCSQPWFIKPLWVCKTSRYFILYFNLRGGFRFWSIKEIDVWVFTPRYFFFLHCP